MYRKKLIKDYFSFSRRDRLGVLVLTLLVVLVWVLPYYFSKPRPLAIQELKLSAALVDSVRNGAATEEKTKFAGREQAGKKWVALPFKTFAFDPNKLDEKGWVALGLREKTAATILKYRSKGGRFRKVEDLQKIWGLPPGFYERVKDSVLLAPLPSQYSAREPRQCTKPAERPAPSTLDLNAADTAALIALPGIGSKLAQRIVTFREKLGGFYSVEQVKETWGLADSVYRLLLPRFRIESGFRKIRINEATADELKQHPYIGYKRAAAIIAYRNAHGNFKGEESLKGLVVFDEAALQKLIPYISY